MNRKLLSSLVLILVFVMQACGPFGGAGDGSGAVETAVAATLAAARGDATVTPAPEDTAIPEVSTPLSTAEDVPAPTDAPAPEILRVVWLDASSNLMIWDEISRAVSPLTADGWVIDFAISDDGQYVVYERSVEFGSSELHIVATDGSAPRLLVDAATFTSFLPEPGVIGTAVYQLEWIPGTHIVAFNTRAIFEGPGLALLDEVRYLDTESGELSTFLEPGSGGNFVFSPDGSQMAIVTPENISLINTDGTNLRRNVIAFPYVITYSEYLYYPLPQWHPDGSYLLAAIPPQDPLAEVFSPTTVWRIPVDGSPGAILHEFYTMPFQFASTQFSPDLTQVTYFVDDGDPSDGVYSLMAHEFGSPDEYIIATGVLNIIGWSPFTNLFVYENTARSEVILVEHLDPDYLINVLMDGAMAQNITWLDATRYIYFLDGPLGWELRLAELDTDREILISSVDTPFPWFDFDN